MENYLFKELRNNITIIEEMGIKIEIKDCLKSEKKVEKFEVKVLEDRSYLILIKLERFNENDIEDIFHSFVKFMEYSYITIYLKDYNIKNNIIRYTFLTANKDMIGFECNLEFS